MEHLGTIDSVLLLYDVREYAHIQKKLDNAMEGVCSSLYIYLSQSIIIISIIYVYISFSVFRILISYSLLYRYIYMMILTIFSIAVISMQTPSTQLKNAHILIIISAMKITLFANSFHYLLFLSVNLFFSSSSILLLAIISLNTHALDIKSP